jgi:excisionase family DNA binding protein
MVVPVRLLSTEQVAQVLGVGSGRVRQLAAFGQLECERIGRGLYFTPQQLERYIEKRRPMGRPRRVDKLGRGAISI